MRRIGLASRASPVRGGLASGLSGGVAPSRRSLASKVDIVDQLR